MQLLLSFTPWVFFWILLKLHKSEPAALAGFLSILALVIWRRLKGRSFKALEFLTLCYFLFLVIMSFSTDLEQYRRWINLWSSSLLVGLALVSFIIGKPFTLPYAREMTPRENWNDWIFIHLNYVISWVWLAIFTVFLVLAIGRVSGIILPRVLDLAIMLSGIIAGLKFTLWYAQRAGIIPLKKAVQN